MAATPISMTENGIQAGTAPLPSRGSFGSALYPMRLLGTGTCIIISGLYLFEFGGVNGWHLFLLGLALIYPHVSRYLSLRIEARKRLEYASVLVDAFILGSSVYIVAFSDVVMLSLLTVALANGMALGGARLMAACVASSGLAITLPVWAWGVPAPAGDLVIMDVIASVFLLLYFIMFASVANRRARLLRASRHEVRRQKAELEIEKRKSDGLLWALLPGALVNDVQAGREPGPREYEEVTLLAARVTGFDGAVSVHGPAKVLAELNHCLKSFDEIVQRHGLEPWRVFGETWLAAAGAPDPEKSADTEIAAREMCSFAAERAKSQHHNDGVSLQFAFAIHRAPALGGLVHARRFSYELWGGVLEGALAAVNAAVPGEIAVTNRSSSSTPPDGKRKVRELSS